ncbi:MAG: segregation/condensation protein A [Pseudomonadota bacterium]|nr:segregation/condensation protein A [Pseudomonadota bacterium]
MNSIQSCPARIDQTWLESLPDDLYIPPEAFAILLERFEGPLDFLLYLVKKNGFDLRHIDIAPIASQYLAYINLMHTLDVELAADYMMMAALLADIKSRLLLPKPSRIDVEDDPRKNLLERLAAYARIKTAAQQLNQQEILGRDRHLAYVDHPVMPVVQTERFEAGLLRDAMLILLGKPAPVVHAIRAEAVELEERLHAVHAAIQAGGVVRFETLLLPRQGRIGVVVTLIAVLELLRQQVVRLVQDGMTDALSITKFST